MQLRILGPSRVRVPVRLLALLVLNPRVVLLVEDLGLDPLVGLTSSLARSQLILLLILMEALLLLPCL